VNEKTTKRRLLISTPSLPRQLEPAGFIVTKVTAKLFYCDHGHGQASGVTRVTAKTSRFAFFTAMTPKCEKQCEKLWRVTGTDLHQVVRIIHVRAVDYNAALHKAAQLPHELIDVRSCVLMEEILRRWKGFKGFAAFKGLRD
jgi:hypothetical protein